MNDSRGMTREEAIAYGKRVIDLGLNDETQAFCKLAIKALEQEPCEDAISRQAVIDIAGISDWFESSDSYNDFVAELYNLPSVAPIHKDRTVQDFVDKCRKCGARYGRLLKQTRWIPVSERLPEDKTYVLATIKVPNRIARARSGWYNDGFFYNDNGDTWKATDKEVIAWMPLPEPYKAESEK